MSSAASGAVTPSAVRRRSATQTPPVCMPQSRGAATARASSTLASARPSCSRACSASTCMARSLRPSGVEILDDDLGRERVELARVARPLLPAAAHLDEALVGFARAQALVLGMHGQSETLLEPARKALRGLGRRLLLARKRERPTDHQGHGTPFAP